MATHDIVVIGASAGGVEGISRVVAALPRDIRAAILVVLHLSRGRSMLPAILTRAGQLPAAHPTNGEPLQYGRIYVAPPDHHMVLQGEAVRVAHGPTENGVRPAVDPLFRSAARVFGPRVVGVVLTGSLDDGTAGLAAVKEAGGIAVVQDPNEAFAPSMPRSALDLVEVDHVLPLSEMGVLITMLARESAEGSPTPSAPHVTSMEPWAALRALEERAALTRKLADRAAQRRNAWAARAFGARAKMAEEQAAIVRQVLLNRTAQVDDTSHDEGPAVGELADVRNATGPD